MGKHQVKLWSVSWRAGVAGVLAGVLWFGVFRAQGGTTLAFDVGLALLPASVSAGTVLAVEWVSRWLVAGESE